MNAAATLERIVRAAARRPARVVIAVAALATVCAALALTLGIGSAVLPTPGTARPQWRSSKTSSPPRSLSKPPGFM